MKTGFRFLSVATFSAIACMVAELVLLPNTQLFAQDRIIIAQADITEKEAYDAAKELGTIEAWEAFLNSYPKGFRADLARAYLKRIASEAPKETPVATPPPPPAPPVEAAAPPPPPPPPPSPADIAITETANQEICKGGSSCSYTIVATNTGGTAFNGQLVIANSLSPRGATLTSTGNNPWFCQTMGGGAVCTNTNAFIEPGASTNLSLTFRLPRRAGGSVTSCASVSWGGAPSASRVIDVQQALNQQGFNVGRPDGQAGRKTVSAIRAFQSRNGMQPTGEIDLPLLMALFTVPGAGDGNPTNDQACAGAAVTAAAPIVTVPAWKPPRGYKKVRKPAATGRCSSRSVWLEGQCILKSQVTSFCGPGYRRQGSRCVSNAGNQFGSDGHLLNRQAGPNVSGCPAGQLQIGSNCINVNLAPLFGNSGRSGTTAQGGGGNNQPKGPQTQNPNGTFTFYGRNLNKQQGGTQTPAPPPIVKGTTKCSSGFNAGPGGKCVNNTVATPPPIIKGTRKCSSGFNAGPGGKCVNNTVGTPQNGQTQCQAGWTFTPGVGCTKPWTPNLNQQIPVTVPKTVACAGGGKVINGKCVCPPNRPRFENGKCKKPAGNQFIQQLQQPQNQPQNRPQNQPQFQQQACISNQVRLGNGQCGCPSSKPRWSKGKCKKAKAINQFLNQLQQPQQQNRPQTQPPSQQQQNQNQQIQQLNNQLNKIFSDVRLKRDVDHLVTLEGGLKLYSYRYLWSDKAQVGVMAQDLLADPARRDAVSLHASGYYMVDYGKLGLDMAVLEEWRMVKLKRAKFDLSASGAGVAQDSY